MDSEMKEAVEKNRRLIEENHHLIKKIHRAIVIGRVAKVVYWIVIFGFTFGAYYLIQPYIEGVLDAYNNVKAGFGKAQEIGGSITEFGNTDSTLKSFRDSVE